MREDETARYTLSSCGIKRIALACMIVDHTGAAIFSQITAMWCIGRLAFPLYAFLTAEACRFSHSREKHLRLYTKGKTGNPKGRPVFPIVGRLDEKKLLSLASITIPESC